MEETPFFLAFDVLFIYVSCSRWHIFFEQISSRNLIWSDFLQWLSKIAYMLYRDCTSCIQNNTKKKKKLAKILIDFGLISIFLMRLLPCLHYTDIHAILYLTFLPLLVKFRHDTWYDFIRDDNFLEVYKKYL